MLDTLKSLAPFLIFITMAIITYIYLDWSILQIIGVSFLLIAADSAVDKKATWVRYLAVVTAFGVLVLGHFYIDDSWMNWGTLVISGILFIAAISALFGLINSKRGDGSVLTVMFLVFIISLPLAIYTLYSGLTGLGIW